MGGGGVEQDGGWRQLGGCAVGEGVWRFWNCSRDSQSGDGLFTNMTCTWRFGLVLDIVAMDALRDFRYDGIGDFWIGELLGRSLLGDDEQDLLVSAVSWREQS